MKKKFAASLFLISMLVSIIAFSYPVSAAVSGNEIISESDVPLRLWYDEPSPIFASEHKPDVPNGSHDVDEAWEQYSLPIGNGYFGANVFGRTETERIQITEKTLVNPHQVKNGGTTYTVGGTNSFSETFIDFGHTGVSDYVRYLDLKTAISGVEYTFGGVKYTREYFTSYPDKALVIKLDADKTGALSFTLRPTVPYEQSYGGFVGDGVSKTGSVVSRVNNGVGEIELSGNMGYYGIDFLGLYRVYTNGGSVTASTVNHTYKDTDGASITDTDGTIVVNGATSAYIVVTLGTDYELSSDVFTSPETNKPTKSTTLEDARVKVEGYMNAINAKISGKSFDEAYKTLRGAHVNDHSALFGRVSLDLNFDSADYNIPTDDLLTKYKNGTASTYFESLLFFYGRYLLIASSRDGTLPANLQGVWNTYREPAWACDYTNNINVEMNYWPAFSTNLAETFKAYVNYNAAYMEQAEIFADELIGKNNPDAYGEDGGNGWVLGDHTTPYKYTSHKSAGNLGFMTQVFWEYYAYTQDEAVLELVYDVLINAARYITKCVELDANGNYLITDCDSPEMFVNGVWYYTDGTTYAQSFAYLNNYNALEAAKALGIDLSDKALLGGEEYSILATVMEQIDKYDPINVGLSGQIKEFREEDYYGSIGDEYQHRHIAQLVGLYPGNLINGTTPAWLDAAAVTLNERGDAGTGWGISNKINMWARLKDGDRALKLLNVLLTNATAPNLWTYHPPFQIDGNFGAAAGISEMLLQSHEGYISPLAALPSSWTDGSYTGLVARGNFTVSAAWENGVAKTFNITSKSGGAASVYYPSITSAKVVDSDGRTVNYTVLGTDLISFETEVGKTYIIYGFTKVTKPEAPKNLDYVMNSDGSYSLTWQSSSSASSYNVYVAVENSPIYELVGTSSKTSFTYIPDAESKNARITFAVTAVRGVESERALAYTGLPRETEYGTIPKENVGYPYAVFAKGPSDSEYTFIESHIKFIYAANAASNLLRVGSGKYRGGEVVIYMLRDSKASGDSFNNGSNIDGTLTVDLGGNALTSGVNRLIGFEAKSVSGNINNVSKVEIKNGALYTLTKPIAEMFSASSFSYSGTKRFELLFDNVTFSEASSASGAVSIFKSRGEFSSSKKSEIELEFRNCTFDYKQTSNSVTLIDCSAGGQYAKSNVKISGGLIKASNLTTVKIFAGSVNDSLEYIKDENGKVTEFDVTSGSVPGVTEYGSIPEKDMTSDKHFAVFAKGPNDSEYTYKGTFGSLLAGALNNSRDMVKRGSGAYAGGTVVIYMFKDYTYQAQGSDNGSFNRAFMIDGELVLDLGGNTLTAKRARVIGFETGSSDIIGGAANYNSSVTFKNGTISSSNPIAEIFAGTSTYKGDKHCAMSFDGVTFKSGASSASVVKVRGSFAEGQSVSAYISFNNCVFDYETAVSVTVFEDSTSEGVVLSEITASALLFKLGDASGLTVMKSTDESDTLVFEKFEGAYAHIELPIGISAPEQTYNGGELRFVKLSENAGRVTYVLCSIGSEPYVPKMSVALQSELAMNIYIPQKNTQKFTLNGIEYNNLSLIADKTINVDGQKYYLFTMKSGARGALDEIKLNSTVLLDGIEIPLSFTFSLVKYAEGVLDTGNEAEVKLSLDLLSYLRAAYTYFGEENSDAVQKIDSLLGNGYDDSSLCIPEGSVAVPEKGLSGASLVIGNTPMIKFYIRGGYGAATHEFYINGNKINTLSGADENGMFIVLNIPPYEMCETISYVLDGKDSGSYHIASYIAWAESESDYALSHLVTRFLRYCQSAREYANSVRTEINFVDERGNKLAASRTVYSVKGKALSYQSPTIEGYYTRDLFLEKEVMADGEINVVYKPIPKSADAERIKEYLTDIVAFGDSITAGAHNDKVSVANEYGIDLEALGSASTGGNYTSVLKNLIAGKLYSGIDIANCGVGGETTSTIAARADTETYYLYLSDAVTVSASPVVIPLTHYSTTGRIGILRQGGRPTVNPVTIVGKDAAGKEISVSGTLDCTLTDDAPSGASMMTCDYKYLKYTFTRNDGKTDTLNFASGARVLAKSSYLYDGRTCIIFMGENGGYSSIDELIKQQKEILVACGSPKYYLIISTHSGTTESRRKLEEALTEHWGENYINMGTELNTYEAHKFAGFTDADIASVRNNIAEGSVSPLLVYDSCHPNAVGYAVIGNIIFKHLYNIGAFDAILDYYDSLD